MPFMYIMATMANIRKLSSGRWQVSIRRRGHSLSKTFKTKAMAESWARDREREIEQGELFAPISMTVSELLNKYEREVTEHKKGKGQESARITLLKTGLGQHSLGSLTPEIVSEWAKTRLRSVGSDTVRRDLSVLSAAVHTGKILWGLPVKDNAAQIAVQSLTKSRTMKRPQRRVRRISDEELERLLWELGEPMNLMVCFALETAMRRGELARMKWGHIKGQSLLIQDDKTGKTTTIPLSTRALAILEAVEGDKGPVFNLRPDSITQAFDRACERAGIRDLRFHDLRHEATNRLFERGLKIEEVAAITRHSDWRSLKIYTHPSHELIAKKLG